MEVIMAELYKEMRPVAFNDVLGQDEVVFRITKMLKDKAFPHASMMTGPSGTGKTSVARIVGRALGAEDPDYVELNCADVRGIDAVRDIRQTMCLSPLGGRARVWVIDEAHKLTNDAQNALLKMLEDTPAHVWFMLCTTEPDKLITTVRNRLTAFTFKALSNSAVKELIETTLTRVKRKLLPALITDIVEASEGSGRAALVMLESVLAAKPGSEKDCIEAQQAKSKSVDLCRLLLTVKPPWGEVSHKLKGIDDEPEKVRRAVLGYMANALLGGNSRAAHVIRCFQYDLFASGKAGLVLACWEASRESR